MNATSDDWLETLNRLAKAARRPDESEEQAFARVARTPAGKALLEMHRDPRGRIPAPVRVVYKGEPARSAEEQLHRLAVAAAASGKSYEQAFASILATAEGKRLWAQANAANGW